MDTQKQKERLPPTHNTEQRSAWIKYNNRAAPSNRWNWDPQHEQQLKSLGTPTLQKQEVEQDLLRGKSELFAREGHGLGIPPGESTQVLGHSWRREEIVLEHPLNFHPKEILRIPKDRSLKAMGKAERRLPLQCTYSLGCHKRGSPECVFRLHSAFPCCLHNRDGPEPAAHVTVSLPNLCGTA